MLKKHFLTSNAIYSTVAHKPDIINSYSNELNKIFGLIADCENQKLDIEKLIEGSVCHEGFHRLN